MNVFCCMYDDRHLLLGIPTMQEWSIKAKHCESGSVLTLHIGGDNEVHLLGGTPVNLSELTIEVKNYVNACPDTIGPAECINIRRLSDEISYIEVIRYAGDVEHNHTADKSAAGIELAQSPHVDRTAFYKWSKILSYMEELLGAVTVASWFDDAMVTEFTEEKLTIEVGSEFRCEVIKRRCLEYIQTALKELWGSDATVEVAVGQNR